MTTETTSPESTTPGQGDGAAVTPHQQRMADINSALENRNRNKAAQLMAEFGRDLPEGVADRLVLANVAQNLGEAAFTRFFASHALKAQDGSDTYLRAAGFVAASGDMATALKYAQTVVEKAKDFAPGWYMLGTLQLQMGDFDAARESLRRALFIQPRAGLTWLALTGTKQYTPDDPEVRDLLDLQNAMNTTAPDNVATYLNGLGKVLDDIGQTDEAARAWSQAASVLASITPYDADADRKGALDAVASVTANTHANLKPSDNASNRPIFVVGIRRCGATLVEQILCSHPEVAEGGDVNLFARAATSVEALSPEGLQTLETKWQSPWRDIGASYTHMIKSRYGAEGRVVDRSLSNTRLTPMIHHVLPNAPIIWVRRNADDTALSAFTTCFTFGARWSFDQQAMAKHFALEDLLFERLAPTLGDKLLVVNYEDLVRDPANQIPRMLAHCGLADNPACHSPHETRRAIQITSAFKAHQPINTNSVGRAQRYQELMAPFREAYAREKAALSVI